MTNRQWPATKIGTAWLTYDPDDGWYEFDNPADAEREFGAIVDHLRDESSDGWHESADTAAWGIWIPIERLRLEATAWAEDDTEEGERCRDAGWDALIDGNTEDVEPDAAAIDFCGRREAAAFKSLREERDTARAEADALRAEVARLRPLRALLEHCEAQNAVVSLSCVPDARLRWLLATGGDGVSCRAHGDLDAVIAAACDRLGVDHG